ncbi:MAG TPA: tetratricopeptide repeat protein [Terriglobia bacterium]|nr:tetratricopeptide repeat protein [Terriglobia bacterium]
MRNQKIKHVMRFLTPRILAAMVAVLWAVGPMEAAEASLNKVSETQVEISGGSGKDAWRLRYGTMLAEFKPHFVASEGNRAWYSYGGWLRWIDTQKGLVIGRWHFPAEIVNLTPEGAKIQVEIQEGDPAHEAHRELTLDPADPHVPYWPTDFLMLYGIPLNEGRMLWPSVINVGGPGKNSAEEAKKILPELEEAVRRDPLTPWFRIGLGRVLRDMGDPRATEVFQEAINTPATDFTELLPISTYFDSRGENDLARAAFERGYQDFWQKGNDPRLFSAIIDRLMVYSPKGSDWGNPATPHGRELIERSYKLMPYGEGSQFAWQLYADYLAAHGSTDDARLWRARAEDSEQNAGFFGKFGIQTDRSLLLTFSSVWAALLYMLVLFARYRPQRRLDLAAIERTAGITRGFAFFNTEYWSRRQRVVFFIIVLVGWFGIGLTGEYVEAILRRASMPISAGAGSFGGPLAIDRFENHLRPSAQRDLLLADAYQQDGQFDKAESLYRLLPQFAESWNNLGVILKAAGKDQQAKAAFEKALELDPKMAEAALNLGRPPGDFWTEQHQKYLPGRPMIAPPGGTHIVDALMGGSTAMVFLRALEGPFSTGGFGPDFELQRNFLGWRWL